MSDGRNDKELNGVTLLGNQNTKYNYQYDPDVLETFDNKHPDNDYFVTFNCPEFTSLCLAGYTWIDVVCDGSIPGSQFIKDLIGTEGYVYSYDVMRGAPVVKRYHSVRKTQVNTKVIRVHLKKLGGGETYIDVTPEHPILVRTGWSHYTWVKASELTPGMKLVADQKTTHSLRGHSRSRLVMQELMGRDLTSDEYVKHRDGNTSNNLPENLVLLNVLDAPSEQANQSLIMLPDSSANEIIRGNPCAKDDLDLAIEDMKARGACFEKTGIHPAVKMDSGDDCYPRQRNSVVANMRVDTDPVRAKQIECWEYYNQGYTIAELSDYYKAHTNTVTKWVRQFGNTRPSSETRKLRQEINLPALNHEVIKIEYIQNQDVYNMEVEDTECFFANGIVVHNCPKTGQPDFATIYINYIPDVKMVESKSLKLYLFSFRNHGDFHEDCVNIIMKDLYKAMEPRYIEVRAHFLPRGGISIDPFANKGKPETDWVNFAKLRLLNHNQDQLRVDNR